MMPALPPLNLSSSSSAKAGDINAPSTVYFGGFGSGGGGGGGALADMGQYVPLAIVGAVVLLAIRHKK